jgi:hypothetical protein
VRVLALPRWLEWLRGAGGQGRVLAGFRRSAYLEFARPRQAVVAVVAAELGLGPLSLVVDCLPVELLQPGTPVRLESGRLSVGPWTWAVEGACPWDPELPRVVPRAAQVRRCWDWLLDSAPQEGIAPVLCHLAHGRGPELQAWQRRALDGLRAMAAGAYAEGTALLCGLGPGLTPSGDDFLCGWMLALHLTGRPRAGLLRGVRATHRISRAYLHAAARGLASEPWHRLVAGLAGDGDPLCAAEAVRCVGNTSGSDTLAGFLLALRRLQG